MDQSLNKLAFELFQEKEKNKRIRLALSMLAKTNFKSKRKLNFEEGVAYGEGVLDVQEALITIIRENR